MASLHASTVPCARQWTESRFSVVAAADIALPDNGPTDTSKNANAKHQRWISPLALRRVRARNIIAPIP
jgi:hypothetical protein